MNEPESRRPLKSRGSPWAQRLAGALGRAKVSPDLISFLGVAFAVLGGAALALSGQSFEATRVFLLLLAVLCIQLRLLCNLLDGMVAVEHGLAGATGPIWNEFPDRVADVVLLAGAGYGAIHADHDLAPALGWLCAALAVMTAYVRELGRGLGFPADFIGPMAKPQRMSVLTVATLASLTESWWTGPLGHGKALLWGLALIAVLAIGTVGRRVIRLARQLKARAREPRS
ncbi:MAG: CDP-alcohol phosphatidyltransferase family protein [Proteobacteria bacterium]|nr:CDP-alcohol phosphatidyltransferase family protein [Pseudomonadota bacterium]